MHRQGRDLGPFITLVDRLAERASAARVAVLAEAVERGESGPGRHGAHAWLLQWAPWLRAGGSARVVKGGGCLTRDEVCRPAPGVAGRRGFPWGTGVSGGGAARRRSRPQSRRSRRRAVRTANPSVAPRASVGSTPLLDVVRRGVASADGMPTTSKEQLFVTVDLEDLRRRTNAGTVLGTTESGCLLGRRRCAAWPATPVWCRWSWGHVGRCWTGVGGCACSPRRRPVHCGCAIALQACLTKGQVPRRRRPRMPTGLGS